MHVVFYQFPLELPEIFSVEFANRLTCGAKDSDHGQVEVCFNGVAIVHFWVFPQVILVCGEAELWSEQPASYLDPHAKYDDDLDENRANAANNSAKT